MKEGVAGLADLPRDELCFVWEQLAQAQRHADDLLNARLQGFVVGDVRAHGGLLPVP